MLIKKIFKFSFIEIIYIISVVVFLIKLNILNKILLVLETEMSALEVIMHNNYKAVKYFVLALALIVIAGRRICSNYKRYNQTRYEDIYGIICIANILVLLILIILIIIYITNPILRLILTASIVGVGAISLSSES